MTAPVPIKNHLTFALQNRAVHHDTTFFWADECWCAGEVLTTDGNTSRFSAPCPGRRDPVRCIGAPVFAFPQVIA
jgi:hypothetical protein